MTLFRTVFMVILVTISLTNCQQRHSEIQSTPKHPNISVLSFNTYLLAKGLNNYPVARLDLIPENVIKVNADIVLLQEVWHTKFKAVVAQDDTKKDQEEETVEYYFPLRLIEQLSKHYPYHAYHDTVSEEAPTQNISINFNDKVENPVDQTAKNEAQNKVTNPNIGTGLVIFSKTPLKNISFRHWNQVVDDNELVSKKGVLYAETEIPSLGNFQIFNSHTSPKTFDIASRNYKAEHIQIKNEQINTLIEFMNQKRNNQQCQILGIDLNSHFFDYNPKEDRFFQQQDFIAPIYQKLVEGSNLDADTDPSKVIQNNVPTEDYATWNNQNNLLVQRGLYGTNPTSKLDFVFSSKSCTHAINSQLVFQEKFKMHYSSSTEKPLRPLSDHYGVLAKIFFKPNTKTTSTVF